MSHIDPFYHSRGKCYFEACDCSQYTKAEQKSNYYCVNCNHFPTYHTLQHNESYQKPRIAINEDAIETAVYTHLIETCRQLEKSKHNKVCSLLVSGSFCPPHNSHIELLELSKKKMESLGWTVITLWTAPSSDSYVKGKLKEEFITLSDRAELLKIFFEGKPYMGVVPFGIASSFNTKVKLEEEARFLLRKENLLEIAEHFVVFEIFGSDTVLRNSLLKKRSDFIAVLREDEEKSQLQCQKKISELSPENHPIVISDVPPEISSTKVRKLFREQKFEELQALVPPKVIEHLKRVPRGVLPKKKKGRENKGDIKKKQNNQQQHNNNNSKQENNSKKQNNNSKQENSSKKQNNNNSKEENDTKKQDNNSKKQQNNNTKQEKNSKQEN